MLLRTQSSSSIRIFPTAWNTNNARLDQYVMITPKSPLQFPTTSPEKKKPKMNLPHALTNQLPSPLPPPPNPPTNPRPTRPSQRQRPHKSPRNGSRKRKMIILLSQHSIRMVPGQWDVVGQDIVRSLDIERFFDFGVWREEEVE